MCIRFGRRPAGYTPEAYYRETADVIKVIGANDKIPRKRNLIGPSTSGHVWHSEEVFATGWLDDFNEYLYGVTVEKYVPYFFPSTFS